MQNGTPALCLACSASLPDKYNDLVFITKCCRKPICQKCINANSRLTRYSPCLMCLAGVDAVKAHSPGDHSELSNLDGGLRDQDIFAIGDDENDKNDTVTPETLALDYSPGAVVLESTIGDSPVAESHLPSVYHIRPDDTLQGITLRFGVSGRELCLLNSLPPSTLTTTPHLLHTRRELLFPTYLHSRLAQQSAPSTSNRKEEEARERERAAKRLQTLTKEADWRIAQAYVALAGDDTNDEERLKYKEAGDLPSDLTSMAAQKYLDDDEWEREQGGVKIQNFPFIKTARTVQSDSNERRWFRKGGQ